MNPKGARFSPCRTWRYALWRHWNDDATALGNCLAFIGLNPSTADENIDDPTVRRCIRFAKDWGHHGLIMLNLYGYRATQPVDMVNAVNPAGDDNVSTIAQYTRHVGGIVAAWGTLAKPWRKRVQWEEQIQRTLEAIGRPVYCLRKTRDGSPGHPLYIPADTKPVLYWKPDDGLADPALPVVDPERQ